MQCRAAPCSAVPVAEPAEPSRAGQEGEAWQRAGRCLASDRTALPVAHEDLFSSYAQFCRACPVWWQVFTDGHAQFCRGLTV